MNERDVHALRQRLTESLARAGEFGQDWMRAAFERVARHAFAPDEVWVWDEGVGGWASVERREEPDRWAELVYGDAALVTQVDDGNTRSGAGALGREATSSISAPGAVVNMLAALDPRPGERVLEIGTGSGYNAALLCERVGDRGVTSVEIDPVLFRCSIQALCAVGYRPHVVLGDGEAGWPAGAPYDRLISTASVRRVPPAWLEQVRPGGVIVTPWFPNYHGRGLIRLRMRGDGTARGGFCGGETFMPVRGQRVRPLDVGGVWAATHDRAERIPGAAPDLRDLDAHGEFALSVRLPGVGCYRQEPDGWFFLAGDNSAWARIAGADTYRYGDRDLLAEVAAAVRWWRENGRPRLSAYTVTATRDRQTIRLHDSEAPPAGTIC
ncbi:protein-L-isoaspartate(D-aspartate) O-methyltransferase [Streptomyces sp. B6B3]|uniref:protein-L-isoaspartate(D-aspartate) O-methyltransferase n=1 Tax=Streptomyces sp. B6B3 TaxID=3153570 RepID=UPI00325D17E1